MIRKLLFAFCLMATGYFVNLAPIKEDNSQDIRRIAPVEFRFRPAPCP